MNSIPLRVRVLLLGILTLFTLTLLTVRAEPGPWKKWDGWKGFQYRVWRDKQGDNGNYIWWIEVRNNYQKTAHVSVELTRRGEQANSFDRFDIAASGAKKTYFTVADPSQVSAWITKVRFGVDSGGYATPDDKD